jgi:signal transduction histidine kinase
LEITQRADAQVLVDFHAFATILDNLVTNAIRHCPRGSRIQVISGLDESSRPVVTVSDNGNGLAVKDLPRLFEPFFRANSNTAGSGLGLTLVLELCRCIEATVLIRRNGAGGLTAEVRPRAAPLGTDASCHGRSAE